MVSNIRSYLKCRLSQLTVEQKAQIEKQLKNHEHKRYTTTIELAPDHNLSNFIVERGVFRSDIMSGIYLARWLFYKNGEHKGKTIIDLGCGPGLLGIVTALYGASHVTASDICEKAVQNTKENAAQYNLDKKMTIVRGDLFENIAKAAKADYILFNHPFFPGEPTEEVPISKSMLGGEKLIQRFLANASTYLKPDGIIIMPFFHLAGETNNPAVQGPKHDYAMKEVFRTTIGDGLQRGEFSIYKLTKNEK